MKAVYSVTEHQLTRILCIQVLWKIQWWWTIDGASVPCANMVDSSHVQIITIQVSGYLLAASVFSSPSIQWFFHSSWPAFSTQLLLFSPITFHLCISHISHISILLFLFLGKLLKRKWEDAMSIDKKSWGYRRNIEFTDIYNMEELTEILASTVRWSHLEFVKHINLLPMAVASRGQGGQWPPQPKNHHEEYLKPNYILERLGSLRYGVVYYLWKIITWIR